MNIKYAVFSLSLLTAIPSALLNASEGVTQTKEEAKASRRLQRFFRKILNNQHTILKLVRAQAGLEEVVFVDVKAILLEDINNILSVIRNNQYDIIEALRIITKSVDVVARDTEPADIKAILEHQHVIINLLNQALNKELVTFDAIVVENELDGFKAIVDNQNTIISLAKELKAAN